MYLLVEFILSFRIKVSPLYLRILIYTYKFNFNILKLLFLNLYI